MPDEPPPGISLALVSEANLEQVVREGLHSERRREEGGGSAAQILRVC